MSGFSISADLAAEYPQLLADDPVVRRIALRDLADEADIHPEIFVAAARDADADIRLEAALALEGTEDKAAADVLADLLEDASPTVSKAAAASLAEILSPSLGPVLLARLSISTGFSRAALLAGVRKLRLPEAVTPALASLDDDLPLVRREAVGVLAYLKAEEAVPDLARRVAIEKDAEVRRALVGALSCSGISASLAALIGALKDPDWQVREEAAVSLGKLLSPESAPALIAALDDEAWEVRLKAANVLGRLGCRDAVDRLAVNLDHAVSNLRKEVANALGAIGDPAARAMLQRSLADPDVDVRKAAQRALERLP